MNILAKLQARPYKIKVFRDSDGSNFREEVEWSYFLSIDKNLVEKRGWKKGDNITQIPTERGIEIVRTADL